ncbi:unnamed protein product [Caenorhabditis angaria]|uniref:Thioredoxin-like protein n=1 Tax=Caenorhabditis angaria TaxID=860376 RepID=A0A9P1MWY1_9PELO|nr:unnamed protein product [Caenorhabditis angaria]
MPVIHVKDDADFNAQFGAAAAKPVFIDFTASWCGPCKMIAPTFDNLSNIYLNALFLKVDVDECADTAAAYGISAMPTFLVFQNGQKLDQLKGASNEKLEQLVKQYAEGSQTPSLVSGQSDITSLIDKKQIECLNGSDDTPLDLFLEGNTNLISDCDEQLIISLPFNQPVKVHSILIKGVGNRSPKDVKIFANLPKTMDFDTASAVEPIQLLTFNESATEGEGQIQNLKYVKFQNVQNIQLFVAGNIGDGEITEISRLRIFGTPLSSVNMNEFKRVAGKAGDAH